MGREEMMLSSPAGEVLRESVSLGANGSGGWPGWVGTDIPMVEWGYSTWKCAGVGSGEFPAFATSKSPSGGWGWSP